MQCQTDSSSVFRFNTRMEIIENITSISFIVPTTIVMTLLTISIFLNLLGIQLLCRYGHGKSTQRVVIGHISVCATILALSELIFWIGTILGHDEYENRFLQAIIIINAGLYGTYYSHLIILTLDRLFACVLHIRYASLCTKKRIYIILFMLCV